MATRTIESPGVEWNEYDLSEVISTAAGTNVVVMGFAHQGPTNQVVEIGTKEELMSVFFGNIGPQNAAERYFYHSAIEILNTRGKLLCIRLPYGSGKGTGFSTGYVATAFFGEVVNMTSAEAWEWVSKEGGTSAYIQKVFQDTPEGESQPILKLNPKPQSFVLSPDLYQEIKDGAVDWGTPIYDPDEPQLLGYSYRAVEGEEDATGEKFTPGSRVIPADFYGSKAVNREAGTEVVITEENFDKIWLGHIDTGAYELVYKGDAPSAVPMTDDELAAFAWPNGAKKDAITLQNTKVTLTTGTRSRRGDYVFEDLEALLAPTTTVVMTKKEPAEGDEPVSVLMKDIKMVIGEAKFTVGETEYEFNAYNFAAKAKGEDGEDVDVVQTDVDNLIELVKAPIGAVVKFTLDPINDEDGKHVVCYEFVLSPKDIVFMNKELGEQIFGAKAFTSGTVTRYAGQVSARGAHTPDGTRVIEYDDTADLPISTITQGTGIVNGVDHLSVKIEGAAFSLGAIVAEMKPYYKFASEDTIVEKLAKSAFFTINQTESSIDEDYQGFYMTVADQDAFVRHGKYINATAGLDLLPDGIQALSMDNVDFSASATSAYDKGTEYFLCEWEDPVTHQTVSGNPAEAPEGTPVAYCTDEITGDKILVTGEPLDTPSENMRLQTVQVPTRLLNFNVTGVGSLSQKCVEGLPYVFDKPEYANAIQIAVHRLFTNIENDKLTYATTEMFTGSFNPNSTIGTKNGGKENYSLDMMTENHSAYITLYQNNFFERSDRTPILVRFGDKINAFREADGRADGVCVSLGGYRSCKAENENEWIGNLPAKIDNALLLIDSTLDRDIDILIDGGLSTIWGYTFGFGEVMEKQAEIATGANYDNTGYDAKEFDDTKYISKAFKKLLRNLGSDGYYNDRAACAIKDSVYSIFTQFDTFCRKTRKDCIFISDPPRFFFVHGEDTKASSKKDWVFSLDMYHPLKNLYEAANSSYSCTYMNWVKKYDNTLADFVWLPMSPFAAEIMCEVDARYYPWWAPFGLNNGVLTTITDIAFRPNQSQNDYFYKTGFNPVCFFNDGGYVIWGQKTLQDKHSAFDRLNVRRLFLYLERKTVKALRYYVGEPNTVYTRNRVIDTLNPIYAYVASNSGLYDYMLKCDEENNPPDVIDDNTLVVDIYLKPVRTIEFILANFYACKTGADFSEIVG